MSAWILCVCSWFLFSSFAVQAEAPMGHPTPLESATVPSDSILVQNEARIGEILIETGDLFDLEDPEENGKFYRAANRLHIKTKDRVVLKLLLFKEGDVYNPRLLEESERILRAQPYLYDATIEPIRFEKGLVSVRVQTRDVWTLRLGVSFKRSGGENETNFGIRELNLWGSGREIQIDHESDVDRTTDSFRYVDPNFLSRRIQLVLGASDRSDGKGRTFLVERPFFALDTRYANGLWYNEVASRESLWSAGEIVDRFAQKRKRVQAWIGASNGYQDQSVFRYAFGLTFDEYSFTPVLGITQQQPENRTFFFPWLELSGIQDRFVETTDFDTIHRTEDRNPGYEWRVRVGRSLGAFSSIPNVWHLEGELRQGWRTQRGDWFNFDYRMQLRHSQDETQDFIRSYRFRWDRRNLKRHLFHVSAEVLEGTRLDSDRQILLGGDTGLRGYPLRYLEGSRVALISVEQRFYTDIHLYRLARIGGAIFVDAGRTWRPEFDTTPEGWIKNVGFGLRIGSSRSATGSMVHIDLAFPLDRTDDLDAIQFLVRSKETF